MPDFGIAVPQRSRWSEDMFDLLCEMARVPLVADDEAP